MQYLRTPDARFENLPGYEFEPNYLQVRDGEGGHLRVHYVDTGPHDAAPILLLHGEPSWSYLYRKMIPQLAAAGHRVIAPDLVGFGRSDKPVQQEDYTYQRHMDWLGSVVVQLNLSEITLFCQDWGGLLGLRLVGEAPQRFSRVIAANTFLPTGDVSPGKAFLEWQEFSQQAPEFPAGAVIQKGTVDELPAEVVAAYDAPFPDQSFTAGARRFPMLVPVTADDPAAEPNRLAWRQLERFDKPFLTAFSDSDPVTRGAEIVLQARIPGARGQPHVTIEGGGHFLQEDRGEKLAETVIAFVESTG